MTNEYVKKLTGKNPKDFEFAAAHIINNSDFEAFKALVAQSDFLFDYIKKNVEKRLANVVNSFNFRNLIPFMTVYSYDYENVIVGALARYADEDLTDEILEMLENGTDEQKAYCAKYFSHINDTLAVELLRKYSFSDFDALALNSAEALSAMNDEVSYNVALEKLKSEDEFEKLSAVRFLVAYKDIKAVDVIFETMKHSTMPENIASEISYLQSFLEFLDSDFRYDTILALSHIINGLGEIVSPSQVFDFQLFDVLEKLIKLQGIEKNGKIAIVLLKAQLKFEQLTENDEYLFDEDKNTKEEIYEIKRFLNAQKTEFWAEQKSLFQSELTQWSDFIFPALDLVQEFGLAEAFDKVKSLLELSNQTIILRAVEVIKSINKLSEINQNDVLAKISDENIKAIIKSNF